jgi:hypothetical protein
MELHGQKLQTYQQDIVFLKELERVQRVYVWQALIQHQLKVQ